MTAPELTQFHLGIVVREIEPVIERYRAMMGVDLWEVGEKRPNGTRAAYGYGAGMTWELFEVQGEGTTQHHQFFKAHGEGVHHIGFWTPDVRASIERALEAGAQLVSTSLDANGNAVVELLPSAKVQESHLTNLGFVSFMDAGYGGVRMEYIGRAGEDFLRNWLKDGFSDIVHPPPPWA